MFLFLLFLKKKKNNTAKAECNSWNDRKDGEEN